VNGTTQQIYFEDKSAQIVRGGFAAEGVAGIISIVLAILGLLNVLPQMLMPIATIVLGAAFLINGGAVASRFSKMLNETAKGKFETVEWTVGLTTEFIGGIAAVILGILTLLNISPAILMPVAAIVFGVALLFSSGITARLNHLQMPKSEEYEAFREVARESVHVATGVEILLGLSAMILGIIAVTGIGWVILTYVALLCVGVSNATSGSAITAKMVGAMRK
jgi:hypothetical protein